MSGAGCCTDLWLAGSRPARRVLYRTGSQRRRSRRARSPIHSPITAAATAITHSPASADGRPRSPAGRARGSKRGFPSPSAGSMLAPGDHRHDELPTLRVARRASGTDSVRGADGRCARSWWISPQPTRRSRATAAGRSASPATCRAARGATPASASGSRTAPPPQRSRWTTPRRNASPRSCRAARLFGGPLTADRPHRSPLERLVEFANPLQFDYCALAFLRLTERTEHRRAARIRGHFLKGQ